MTATMNVNGKGRKTLADQLDRLDTILDVLGDGLNEAVAEAVKSAVAAAVQQVLAELLTNPEVLNKLQGAVACPSQPVEKKSTVWQRLRQVCQGVRRCIEKVRAVCGVHSLKVLPLPCLDLFMPLPFVARVV